jgi:hypothetical protein
MAEKLEDGDKVKVEYNWYGDTLDTKATHRDEDGEVKEIRFHSESITEDTSL